MIQPSAVRKHQQLGVETILMERGSGLVEASLTVQFPGNAGLAETLLAARDELASQGLIVLRQSVFGVSDAHDELSAMNRDVLGEIDWPVTWVTEYDARGVRPIGTHLYCVAGADVRRLVYQDEIVGSVFADEWAEYAHLGGIVSGNPSANRVLQARDVLERLEAITQLAGMEFEHIVRTWFYNDRILEWYGEFNTVRTKFFQERAVFDGLVPASTGIGGVNSRGAALIADALAIRVRDPESRSVAAREVVSPMQCPATDYRSSFSRAVEVTAPDHRKLFISGTASIEPGGKTAYLNDVKGQVNLTLEVVQALLASRNMDWPDVTRAIAYIKQGADVETCRSAMASQTGCSFPVVLTANEVCRGDLLFELELDAWQPTSAG